MDSEVRRILTRNGEVNILERKKAPLFRFAHINYLTFKLSSEKKKPVQEIKSVLKEHASQR